MATFVPASGPISDYGGYYRSAVDHQEYVPANPDQLLAGVIEANRLHLQIRVRGNGHSMNGTAVPRTGELLLRTTGLNSYRFEEEGTITVGAGAAIFDVHRLLGAFGYDLAVYNDGGAPASSVGGFVAAGGFGAGSAQHGGFWETVASLEVVTGGGRRMSLTRGDEPFHWLFGSMGQLAIVAEARLRIIPLAGARPTYPAGQGGNVARTRHAWERTIWYTVFVPRGRSAKAGSELTWIGFANAPTWVARPPYAYLIRFATFTPPLIHPLQDDLVAIGLWGEVSESFDLEKLRRLDAAITAWTRANPEYRRYAQSELLFPAFDYRGHFGASCFARFAAVKDAMDPLGLLGRGIVEAAPMAGAKDA